MEAIRHAVLNNNNPSSAPNYSKLELIPPSLPLTVCATPPRPLHAPCEQLFVSLLVSPSLCLPNLTNISREIGNLAKNAENTGKTREMK